VIFILKVVRIYKHTLFKQSSFITIFALNTTVPAIVHLKKDYTVI